MLPGDKKGEEERNPLIIKPPPSDISAEPDKYTQRAPDFTGPYADNRVFFIDTRVFKYGTRDQGHAAAIVLAVLLLLIILILGLVGSDVGPLISVFSLVAGVAVGKSLGASKSED